MSLESLTEELTKLPLTDYVGISKVITRHYLAVTRREDENGEGTGFKPSGEVFSEELVAAGNTTLRAEGLLCALVQLASRESFPVVPFSQGSEAVRLFIRALEREAGDLSTELRAVVGDGITHEEGVIMQSVKRLLSGLTTGMEFKPSKKYKTTKDFFKQYVSGIVQCYGCFDMLHEVPVPLECIESFIRVVLNYEQRQRLVDFVLIYVHRLPVAADSVLVEFFSKLMANEEWKAAAILLENTIFLMDGWPDWVEKFFGASSSRKEEAGRGGRDRGRDRGRGRGRDRGKGIQNHSTSSHGSGHSPPTGERGVDEFASHLPPCCRKGRDFSPEHRSFVLGCAGELFETTLAEGSKESLKVASRLCKSFRWADRAAQVALAKSRSRLKGFVDKGKWQLAEQLCVNADHGRVLLHLLLEAGLFIEAKGVRNRFQLWSEPEILLQDIAGQQASRKRLFLHLPAQMISSLDVAQRKRNAEGEYDHTKHESKAHDEKVSVQAPGGVVVVNNLSSLMLAAYTLGYRDAMVHGLLAMLIDGGRRVGAMTPPKSWTRHPDDGSRLERLLRKADATSWEASSEEVRHSYPRECWGSSLGCADEEVLIPASHASRIVGLDSEWRAVMYEDAGKEGRNGASVLQVAAAKFVFIFDLRNAGACIEGHVDGVEHYLCDDVVAAIGMHILLRALFACPYTIKLGWDFNNGDLLMLKRAGSGFFASTFNEVRSLVDLASVFPKVMRSKRSEIEEGEESCPTSSSITQDLSEQIDTLIGAHVSERDAAALSKKPKWALTDACQLVMGRPLDKSEQLSNWDARPLSSEQLHYAALDAYSLLWQLWIIGRRGARSDGCDDDGPVRASAIEWGELRSPNYFIGHVSDLRA